MWGVGSRHVAAGRTGVRDVRLWCLGFMKAVVVVGGVDGEVNGSGSVRVIATVQTKLFGRREVQLNDFIMAWRGIYPFIRHCEKGFGTDKGSTFAIKARAQTHVQGYTHSRNAQQQS